MINDDGTAQPLPVDGNKPNSFPLHFSYFGNVADPRDRKENIDRPPLLKKFAKPLPKDVNDAQASDYAAGLIRTSQFARAAEVLTPRARSRRPSYTVVANYVQLLAAERRWAEAYQDHLLLDDLTPPKTLGTMTPAQLTWLKKVETEWYRRWLKLHTQSAKANTPPSQEQLLPLFAEKKPADAIAIVQQVLLWSPSDAKLYWLLAKLYWDAGHLRQAKTMYDGLISEERGYGNRQEVQNEYAKLAEAVKNLPPEKEPDLPEEKQPDPPPPNWLENLPRLPIILCAAVVLLLLVFQIRTTLKRWRR